MITLYISYWVRREKLLAVEKFYAIYKHEDGTTEIIDIYQAIRLVYDDAVIVTKPKEKCPLYDVETYLKVSPRRSNSPHFRYYPDEESPLKDRPSLLEYTQELKTFIRAFEEIESFKIEEWGNDPITVIPKNMYKLKRIETNDSFVVLKFFVEIKETVPYSYYYKYNGLLGLEFSVTSQPEPIKRRQLGEKGIPLFRSNIKFPSWISVPDEFQDEEEFELVARELKKTYQDRNYRLQGDFINDAVNFPEYKEKYTILNEFERQCEELKELKKQYEEEIVRQREQLGILKEEKEKERIVVEKYRQEIDHYEKLKDDNKNLVHTTNYLRLQQKEDKQKLSEYEAVNTRLANEKRELKNRLDEIANQGFFKKLINRKGK